MGRADGYLWILIALALTLTGEIVTTAAIGPRGIRNNNPGNIRHSADRWEGMSDTQTDSAFVQFVTPEYGIRALAKLLNNYRTRYGLHTTRAIISRWAPPSENNTLAYVRAAAAAFGKDPDAVLTDADMPGLMAAIIHHENGAKPYTRAQLQTGIQLAGLGWQVVA